MELGPLNDADVAVKDFGKKYRRQTGNKWEDRDHLLSIRWSKWRQAAAGAIVSANAAFISDADKAKMNIKDCMLDSPIRGLVDLIFEEDMFRKLVFWFRNGAGSDTVQILFVLYCTGLLLNFKMFMLSHFNFHFISLVVY